MKPAIGTFRLYICRSPGDMDKEWDTLQGRVFPQLNILCETNNANLEIIDLAKDVNSQDVFQHTKMIQSLQEIKNAPEIEPSPLVLILLGDRYGWRPPPYQINSAEYDQIINRVGDEDSKLLGSWYFLDQNAVPPEYVLRTKDSDLSGDHDRVRLQHILANAASSLELSQAHLLDYTASALHQLIAGAIRKTINVRQQVFGFFRSIQNLPPDVSPGGYIDIHNTGEVDQDSMKRVISLKRELRSLLGPNSRNYDVSWLGNDISKEHLDPLGEDVFNLLSSKIQAEIKRIDEIDPLWREIDQHDAFAKTQAEGFAGREELLRKLIYQEYINRPLVVWGEKGSGKTALLAQSVVGYPIGGVINRFVGATPGSYNPTEIIKGLCFQIAIMSGIKSIDIPENYPNLIRFFFALMNDSPRPLQIVIDGVDLLKSEGNIDTLAWIPLEVPQHVRLIVSTGIGSTLESLRSRSIKPNLIELEPLTSEEGEQILDTWLSRAVRTLQPDQRRKVLGGFSGSPPRLRALFEEARCWTSGEEVQQLKKEPEPHFMDDFIQALKKSNQPYTLHATCVYTLIGHSDRINGCAFSSDGKLLASASNDRTVKIWDVASGREIRTLTDARDAVFDCDFSPDGEVVLAPIKDKAILRWETRTGAPYPGLVGCYQIAQGGSLEPEITEKLMRSHDVIAWAHFPEACWLVTTWGHFFRDTIKVWNAQSGEAVVTLSGHENEIRYCSFSSDKKRIATVSEDKTIRVWEVETENEIACFKGDPDFTQPCGFSPDGKHLAAGVQTYPHLEVNIWNIASGASVSTLTDRSTQTFLRSVEYSGDGSQIITASSDHIIRTWDASTGSINAAIDLSKYYLDCCALSRNGKMVASGTMDSPNEFNIRIWELS